jgi:fructan beta-fructosidase
VNSGAENLTSGSHRRLQLILWGCEAEVLSRDIKKVCVGHDSGVDVWLLTWCDKVIANATCRMKDLGLRSETDAERTGIQFLESDSSLGQQAFPFRTTWDTGFMYWGHAVSKYLIYWQERSPALMLDHLGSPWSGSSLVDHNNDGGWGKDALVLVYTAFDRRSKKQVQCIAYSTDDGATCTRYAGNPIVDSNSEVGSNDTWNPKVFWYAPTKHWVMILFQKDGVSFFTSTDLKGWTRKSHIKGLHECPDLFELPIDGARAHTKWILHGGSSSYFIRGL